MADHPLTYRRIFVFWYPLALMWFLMAVEQPVVTAFIARMAEPKINLAAYGVVYSVAMIIESPIIMLLSAGTALPKGGRSYRRLVRFSHLLIAGLTALHLLIGLTPLYNLILLNLIGVPREVAEVGRGAFLMLTVWPGAVGYRRLWQGILIRHGRTGVVPVTIAVRLLVSAGLLSLGFWWGRFSGAFTGAAALAAGIVAGAVAAYLFVRPSVREHYRDPESETDPLSWGDLIRFYVPLALTTLILLAARPLLSVALARLPRALDSLAVWPVLLGVSFLGRSIAMSFQEAGIALLQSRRSFEMLQRFARILGAVMLAVFLLFGATPLAYIWFRRVVGLSVELTGLTRVPMLLLALLPAMGALISWQRGVLISSRMTPIITRSVLVNLIVLCGLLLAFGYLLPLSGVLITSLVYVGSVLAELFYLSLVISRQRRQISSGWEPQGTAGESLRG